MPRPFLILIVLDGFGCRNEREYERHRRGGDAALRPASTAIRRGRRSRLRDSRSGCPTGQMGNSEVGHLNMGAGRVVDQDIVRISKAIAHRELQHNPTFIEAVKGARAVHFAGLLSDGGVHSLQEHLHGMIDAALRARRERCFHPRHPRRPRHAAEIGREVSRPPARSHPTTSRNAHLATVIGRYYTMDRDQRWERVQRGYDLLTLGVGTETKDPLETMRRFYEQNVTDEFMEPISVADRRRRASRARRRRRRADLLQLPRGPDAPDRHRVQGRRTSTAFERAVHPKCTARHDEPLSRGLRTCRSSSRRRRSTTTSAKCCRAPA